jgi:hypothetical protein
MELVLLRADGVAPCNAVETRSRPVRGETQLRASSFPIPPRLGARLAGPALWRYRQITGATDAAARASRPAGALALRLVAHYPSQLGAGVLPAA